MHTETSTIIQADVATIYRIAADIERWPQILPHYRWVRVLRDASNHRLVEMAARRDGIPVWWCAEQWRFPDEPRMTFRHVRGVTAGMEVEWSFAPESDGVHVGIRHDLRLLWPVAGELVGDWIVGRFFVSNIAGKTLRRIKQLAESQTHAAGRTP